MMALPQRPISGLTNGEELSGDPAEVLVFDRLLRFDELLAVQNYLRAKWSLDP